MNAIIVHGGAGAWPEDRRDTAMAGCVAAIKVGRALLNQGGRAIDAVEAAVRVLESDPTFNAGRGAHATRDGIAELDAILIDGAACDFGAVTGLVETEHPISVARRVMEVSPHRFLAGAGATAFAREHGFPAIANDELVLNPASAGFPPPGDTVGAVAADTHGHLAAGTSTGGIRGKWSGRVGDSPIIGSGAYADERCAVSATGHGESIMRVMLARTTAVLMEQGASPHDAAEEAIQYLRRKVDGKGGLIYVTAQGEVGYAWNTAHMPYAYVTGDGPIMAGF